MAKGEDSQFVETSAESSNWSGSRKYLSSIFPPSLPLHITWPPSFTTSENVMTAARQRPGSPMPHPTTEVTTRVLLWRSWPDMGKVSTESPDTSLFNPIQTSVSDKSNWTAGLYQTVYIGDSPASSSRPDSKLSHRIISTVTPPYYRRGLKSVIFSAIKCPRTYKRVLIIVALRL